MELTSTSPSSSSSTSTGREGNSSGRYPDVCMNVQQTHSLQQRATASLHSPSVAAANSSRPRRCSYCNKSSFNSCSCSFQSGGDHRTNTSSSSINKSQSQVVDVGEVTAAIDNHTSPHEYAKSVSEQYGDGSGRKHSAPTIKDKRKWEYFPGKNKFYFNGRLMTAPSIRFCMLSFILILVTFVLFIVFDGPFLAEHLTIAIPITGSILFFMVIVNMLKTSCSDPGILPRASAQESEFIEKSYANPNGLRPPPRTKDIIVNGQTIKSKYCFTCKMFRPPRASHCSICDNCVDRFDHHCPFLGNCIGSRNYRNFYTFIVSLSLLAVFVLSCSITKLALLGKDKGNFLEALRESPTSAIVILISFLGMWTVIGLAGFHTYLIAVEQTTNEDLKGMFGRANAVNPYTRGNFCQNCCFILCGPHQPSLIDSRGIVTTDFFASLPKKSGGNDSSISTAAPCNPPTSIRPHCGEGSNTPRNELTTYQIPTMESHKLGIDPGNMNAIQTSASANPLMGTVNNSRSSVPRDDLANKAATVPASSILRSPPQNAIEVIPSVGMSHSNQQTTNSLMFSSQKPIPKTTVDEGSMGGPMSQNYSTPGRQTSSRSKSQTQIQSDTDNREHVSLSMDQLDFPEFSADYNSPPALRNSNRKTMGISTSVPLITSVNHNNKQQQHYGRNNFPSKDAIVLTSFNEISNGHGYGNAVNNSSSGGRNGHNGGVRNVPINSIALAFDEDDEYDDESTNLEKLTMINSPLHLDSIS